MLTESQNSTDVVGNKIKNWSREKSTQRKVEKML